MPKSKQVATSVRPVAPAPTIEVERIAETIEESMTVEQLAETFGVSRVAIYRWMVEGLPGRDGGRHVLAYFKLGRSRYIRRKDVNAFLEAINASA